MASYLAKRKAAVSSKLASRTRVSGWVLEKQPTSFAEEGEWTNIDSDVTPEERRTWSSLTIAGFWFSDALNAQGWEAPICCVFLVSIPCVVASRKSNWDEADV
ncbi:hypothetical protein ACEPPN_005151 [Leptodophora sp. 'Broadleaf-Isolate-01']